MKMLTKEDYMKLGKERLAELLVEKDAEIEKLRQYYPPIYLPYLQDYTPKCYEPGGTCTNPHHDCINCPRLGGIVYGSSTSTFTTGTGENIGSSKDKG